MKPDRTGTPTEQILHRIGWQPAGAADKAGGDWGQRCWACHHREWSDTARTPRMRCGRHGVATTARARCNDWAERDEAAAMSADAWAAVNRALRVRGAKL